MFLYGLAPMKHVVKEKLLSALFEEDAESLANLCPILTLSVSRVGLGIPLPSATVEHCYKASLDGLVVPINALKEGDTLDIPTYIKEVVKVRQGVKEAKVALEEIALKGLLNNQTAVAQCHLL